MCVQSVVCSISCVRVQSVVCPVSCVSVQSAVCVQSVVYVQSAVCVSSQLCVCVQSVGGAGQEVSRAARDEGSAAMQGKVMVGLGLKPDTVRHL